ncbi:putative cytochrome P450 4aa1 [Trachymyrmex zeteki]|uniref:Putative cytochrome P450 4aa1 n=1 Tax=Mycetomoellerius zeteki TaxID=64791 RepID=A0A151XDS6_9HYME|nr:putative cytochrome P450 4aa1 [Trachymyrmex zeteki]
MWTYFVFLIVIYVIYALKNYVRILRFIFTLDGPKTVPIIGNSNIFFEENLIQRMTNEAQSYGRVFRIWLTVLPYVMLVEPEDIQVVLSSMKHTHKIFFYKLLDNFLGKGLITQNVEQWKVHRRILQPIFHRQVLEKFIGIFSECADRLVDNLLEKDGKDINITVFINNSVYDILNETILGTPANQGKNDSEDDPFRKGQVMMPYRFARPWLLIDWLYRLTAAGKSEEQQPRDLRIFEKEWDIIEECCTFMLAGQDSVGTATAITLFLLANNPKWQERCVAELHEIFSDDTRSPTMQDFKKMTCLDMCIKESLRLYPSVPFVGRTLGEDVKLGKYIIPAGCGVFIAPYCTHRLSHHFPDPHDFKPERFSSENSEGRHPYAYIPFSAGPRNCIGYKFAMLEIKSVVSAILRKYRLESTLGKEKVIAKFRLTIRAQGGLWVKVKVRDEQYKLTQLD